MTGVNMKSLSVNATQRINYNIYFDDDIFESNNEILLVGRDGGSSHCLVIVDSEVNHIYGQQIDQYFSRNVENFSVFELNGGEARKNNESFDRVFAAINQYPINRRNEPVVIIGGGVVTDVAGFASSCFRRGVPHVKVPTTLMGYVDASVGIKTGINYGRYKNRMGSFFPPLAVVLDKSFMASQSARDLANGIGEIIKIAVIKNRVLFEYLEIHVAKLLSHRFQLPQADYVLRQSIVDMLEELEPNLFEDQLERLVDFGHTFSLAFEMESDGMIQHGEAVAMDVLLSCQLSCQRQMMTPAACARVFALVRASDIVMRPELMDPTLMWHSLCERVLHRNGLQRVPLPKSIGRAVFVNDLSNDEIRIACEITQDKFNH
jgi:3-dehydroquinate synthetase